MKVQSLCSARIFKNMMNNYSWALIIWWKKFFSIYFIKNYWIKNLLSIVIRNKKYLVLFHKHKINSLHVYYLSAVLYLVCLFCSFFMQNWILRYTCKYFFQQVLKFSFYNFCFFKALRTWWCISYCLQKYFFISINNIQNFCEEKDWTGLYL